MSAEKHRCGLIAVIGRPNVGKSTLINSLIGDRITITSRKPQTTRHHIKGILSTEETQFVFVDTPGFQSQHRDALNLSMNRNVTRALREVDLALLVIEAGRFGEDDRLVLAHVPKETPIVLVVNKIDCLTNAQLAAFLQPFSQMEKFVHVVPVSAEERRNTVRLLSVLRPMLPEQASLYDEDALTDRSERFLAAERIREKLFRQLGDEVPYGATVIIEKFEHVGNLRSIYAAIIVNKQGHKPILIGSGGKKMKAISSAARLDLEKLFGGKIYLEIWVKVRAGWTNNSAMLSGLGYD